jgi:hypothetical protein
MFQVPFLVSNDCERSSSCIANGVTSYDELQQEISISLSSYLPVIGMCGDQRCAEELVAPWYSPSPPFFLHLVETENGGFFFFINLIWAIDAGFLVVSRGIDCLVCDGICITLELSIIKAILDGWALGDSSLLAFRYHLTHNLHVSTYGVYSVEWAYVVLGSRLFWATLRLSCLDTGHYG